MTDSVMYKRGEHEGYFDIINTPPELRATGYLGDLAILNTNTNVAYPVNASIMARLMNGYTNISGVKIK